MNKEEKSNDKEYYEMSDADRLIAEHFLKLENELCLELSAHKSLNHEVKFFVFGEIIKMIMVWMFKDVSPDSCGVIFDLIKKQSIEHISGWHAVRKKLLEDENEGASCK